MMIVRNSIISNAMIITVIVMIVIIADLESRRESPATNVHTRQLGGTRTLA